MLRVAVIRLYDLAATSRAKAVELGRPALADDAAGYTRDGEFLADLRRQNSAS